MTTFASFDAAMNDARCNLIVGDDVLLELHSGTTGISVFSAVQLGTEEAETTYHVFLHADTVNPNWGNA